MPYFVGYRKDNLRREVFQFDGEPSERTHGHLYHCAVGPFRTKLAADYMAGPGGDSPICNTVADAERLAGMV